MTTPYTRTLAGEVEAVTATTVEVRLGTDPDTGEALIVEAAPRPAPAVGSVAYVAISPDGASTTGPDSGMTPGGFATYADLLGPDPASAADAPDA